MVLGCALYVVTTLPRGGQRFPHLAGGEVKPSEAKGPTASMTQ